MIILVAGVNYKTAPVEMREKLAVPHAQLQEGLEILQSHLDSGVLLSTCNRTEVYALSPKTSATSERISRFLSQLSGLPQFVISSYLYSYQQQEAVKHLFRVTCGLDSMIYGEAQILGQVRHGLEAAQAQGLTVPPLVKLFRAAVRVGRRVRSDTEIGRHAASVSSASVELAGKLLKDLGSANLLVLGAGRIARRAAQTLVDKGATRVTLVNRTYERGAEVARELGIQSRPFSELALALAGADLAIVATASPDYVLSAAQVRQAQAQRLGRPLYLIDLSVPRNIDPEAGRVKNVLLHDIDDLREVSQANLEARRRGGARVEAIVEAEAAKFMDWWQSLDSLPTLAALRSQAEAIRQRELARTMRKLSSLPQEERWRLEALTTAIVNKILHRPSIRLRQSRDGLDYRQAVADLFGLKEDR